MLHMPGPAPIDPAIRYHAKVDKRGPNDCWEWTAARFDKGYGAFRLGPKQLKAHRFGYELLVGPIPHGLYVLHTCDNPPCQNPRHWFLGTHKDNAEDREQKQRGNHIAGEDCPWSQLTDKTVEEIRRLYADGATQMALAAQFGLTQSYVSEIVRGRKWRRAPGDHVTQNRQVKLTVDAVREIRSLYARGHSQQAIATRFGVTQRCVSQVILRQTWKDVE